MYLDNILLKWYVIQNAKKVHPINEKRSKYGKFLNMYQDP